MEGGLLATSQPFIQDEVDAIRSRWAGVRDAGNQSIEQQKTLVGKWEDLHSREDAMSDKLTKIEKLKSQPPNLASPNVEDLENQQAELKVCILLRHQLKNSNSQIFMVI